MSLPRLVTFTALAVLLAACNGDSPEEGQATGEVLEGTISDEMLPLDQVRSEAPLADPSGGESPSGASGTEEEAAGETDPATEPPEAAPAEEPAAAAEVEE